MANKYLNDTGLQYFYNKLKTIFQMQESGKGLSTNDYTTTEKNKLSGIASGAQVNKIESVKVNGTALTITSKAVDVPVPTKTSDLTNDSNFPVDASYVHTDNNYTTTEKTKLSGIATGAEVNQKAFSNVKVGSTTVAADTKTDTLELVAGSNITLTPDATNDKITIAASVTVDSALSDTSENPVQNKVIKEKFDDYNGEMLDQFTANTDLNTVTTAGVYYCKNDYIFANIPTSQTWGYLIVEKYKSDITSAVQTFINNYGTWKRIYTSGSWGSWNSYALLASPTFTGTPKAPTAAKGTNTTQIATTAFVKTAVDTAVAGITEFDIQVVTALPDTGVKGTIYLLSHSHGTGDVYDEYIWTGSGYEKIGNTDIDLSDYLKKTDMVAITTSEIDTLFA